LPISLFKRKPPQTPEDKFWSWFASNENRLFSWEEDQDAVFSELGAAMCLVHEDLTFEFGPIADGKREFVISAGGIKSAFPSVEALHAKAPALPRWEWVKFRPRRPEISDIQFGEEKVSADDVHYVLVKHGQKIGIILFFDGYSEEKSTFFGQVGYLFLDEALGEFAVEMQLGVIEFHPRESAYFDRASPLRELPSYFDEYWAQQAH
jgi:hypothetical protein